MTTSGRANRKAWALLALFIGWGLAAVVLAGFALSGLERFGSAAGWAIVSGTARVDTCASSWFGAPYECRAEVTWTGSATGEQWRESVSVYSMSPLSGEVAVERRTDRDRKADEDHGRVYPVGHPVQTARGWSVAGVFAVFLATLFIPVWLVKRRRAKPVAAGGGDAAASDLDARRAAEKRLRRRK
ncbi:hypothetical protein [Phytomonospora endophytica]|uniref:Uncharacterized protein n=1 Tax=Phytomonospora endophytica TaxID=714109 RepID=A0A841FGZ8_9ACTN|nr:hypothetical protein [Phytomonospora endophytica]MBB6034975.1 hypothetical protein [Phytomonospora endophytica]GIG71416.1 hypothetical protein Pen01_77110 [Phytomonospora endophytica]